MKKQDNEREIEVRIYSIATSLSESIIFLDEIDGTRILPIWIGPFEAQAIAIRLSGFPSPRPMTHDLIFSIFKILKLKLKKIVITEIRDNTYYSIIHVEGLDSDVHYEIDSRPSDAIAISVRFGCPIYVRASVFEKTQVLNKPITEEEVIKFKEDLKNISPKDIINQLLSRGGSHSTDSKTEKKEEKEDEEEEEK